MNPDAASEAHEILVNRTNLYDNIVRAAGQYDAKIDPSGNCSLAAHILNAVTIGVNTFVFNAVGEHETVAEYEEEIKVLAAALALHDTNKFVQEAHGIETGGNTPEAFDQYFGPEPENATGDPFGIVEFLGEDYREDLLYLVQRTELTEDSSATRGHSSEFGGLARYCRIGDAVASVSLDSGLDGAYAKLAEILDENRVHKVEFTRLEQPVLNDLLIGCSKEVIAGEAESVDNPSGVIVGSSPNAILYLGDKVDRQRLQAEVLDILPGRIRQEFKFACKLTWNSFEYDILSEVSIDVDQKEEIISDAFRELLEGGSAGVEGFEYIPDEFDQYFPVLAKSIYIDGQSEFEDPDVQRVYDQIKEDQGGQKVKIHFIAYLVQNLEANRPFLESHAASVRPKLHEDLKQETDAIEEVTQRFFEGPNREAVSSKDHMCFLCGAEARSEYTKGNTAIYRTQAYSRRVPPHSKYKSICEVCNLEYALLSDICERSGVSTNNSVEVAYFYFDDFLGDVRVRQRRAGNIVQGDSEEIDDLMVSANLLRPQYYLQPVFVMDENHRMAVVRQVMEAARESGMKVVIGRPFTRFESADGVFADEEATRPQELLGLDFAERFGPLPSFADREDGSHLRRALQLFRIMSIVGQEANMTNPYLQLDRDTFHSIADFAVVNHDAAAHLQVLEDYFESYHETALMDMKTVADRGIDLFGKQFDSKYKKTKVFREAIDAFLSGMNQRMEDEDLRAYVESQVYAAADREDYAGHATTDEAAAFVEAIESYLEENDLHDLKKLSDWEDALVNSYYYAYEQTLHDR